MQTYAAVAGIDVWYKSFQRAYLGCTGVFVNCNGSYLDELFRFQQKVSYPERQLTGQLAERPVIGALHLQRRIFWPHSPESS